MRSVARLFGAFLVAFFVAFLAMAALLPLPARAQGQDFYAGKTIRLLVDSAPGGGYDAYARVLAKFWGNYIPGKPSIVVENLPGGSGLKLANYMGTVAPRDGTVIGATHAEIIAAQKTSADAAKVDVNKFSWLGSLTADPLVAYVWSTTPIMKFEDLRDQEVIMAGTSSNDSAVTLALLAKAMLGVKIKVVSGYHSASDVKLAISRGEAQGAFAHSWSSLQTSSSDWLRDKQIRPILQHFSHRLPALANVPTFGEFATNEEDRQAIAFMVARQEAAKPYYAPPEVPAERVQILRRAFDAVLADKGFLDAATKARLSVNEPMTGEQLTAFVTKISQTPASVIERIDHILAAAN